MRKKLMKKRTQRILRRAKSMKMILLLMKLKDPVDLLCLTLRLILRRK